LLDIQKFGQDILGFVEGMDEVSFQADLRTQNAVLYGITLMGEATKRLSSELRATYPDVPWKQMAGMRDKCIHDYRQINLQQVWQVTQRDIPVLLRQVEQLLLMTRGDGG